MATKCTPENLESVLNKIYDEYLNKVSGSVGDDVKEVGKTCKKLVQAYAQSSGIGGTKYTNSFTTTTEAGRYVTTVTIHSKKYQIAHLLENGHKLVVHGVVCGTTRPFKHFAPAEEEANELLEKKIKLTIESES